MTDDWRLAMLVHSRLRSHHRLIDRTIGEIETALEAGERPAVAVSGGKDSTCLLHLVLRVAGAIDAQHGEDEIVAPGTAEYVESLASWPGVTLRRLACPIRHGTECVSWAEEPHLRPLPAGTHWFPTRAAYHRWRAEQWDLMFIGTRREESSARELTYRRRGSLYHSQERGYLQATPLHRWTLADVWAYLLSREVPYHPAYDQMRAAGVPLAEQRVGPTGDERAAAWGSFGWLRMTWPAEFERIAQRHPWVRQHA